MKFKLVKGGLHHENGKYYKPGDIIETDRDLVKMFPKLNKFKRIEDSHSPKDSKEGNENDSPPAVDVTDISDKELLELNLRVVKRGAWFDVVDAITGNRLNQKSLRKSELSDFIKQYKVA